MKLFLRYVFFCFVLLTFLVESKGQSPTTTKVYGRWQYQWQQRDSADRMPQDTIHLPCSWKGATAMKNNVVYRYDCDGGCNCKWDTLGVQAKDTLGTRFGMTFEQPNPSKTLATPRVVGVKSVAELRTLTVVTAVDTQFVIQLTNYTLNYTQYYQYDPNDVTSVDNGATIIKAGTKVFRAIFPSGVVNAKIFGLTGNGSTDDHDAFQNACDILVANPSLPRNLYFPKGVYRITKPVIIYKWDGTQYQQCNVNLIGQEYQHWNDITTVARIVLTDPNTFAIGIQQGRSMVIKGLSIEGPFNPGGGINDAYYKRTFANWASDYGMRDQPQSPLCGINIDPFSNSASFIPADGGYPGYTSWYRGTMSNGGSSGIHVEQCRIFGFTVGIGVSLNSWTQNGEDMVFRDLAITICKVAYAAGQLQTKDNFIYNGISDDRVYAIVSGDYGSGHGCQPYIVGYNIAGAVISLCHGLSSQFPVSFQNVFAEGLYQIGDAQTGAGSTELINCNFDFTLFLNPIAVPPYHWKGDNAKFRGCTMRYYDDSLNKRLYFNGGQIAFDNCWFDKPPIGKYDQGASVAPTFSFNECRTGNGELIGWRMIRGELSNPGYKIVKQGTVDVYDDGGTFTLGAQGLRSMHLHFDFGGLNRFAGVASGQTVTVDTLTRKATFTIAAGAAALIAAGDYIMYGPAHDSVLGKITSVNYSTGAIAVTNVPIGVKTGTNYDMVSEYYEIARGAVIGKSTNASTTIDSVKFLPILGLPQVGDRSNIGYPGSIITQINATNFVISTGAYYTRSQDYGPMDRSEKIDVTSYYDPSHANLDGWNFLVPKNTIWKIWTSPYTNAQHTYEFNEGGYIHMSTVSGPPTYWQSQWSLTSDNNWDAWRITEGKNRLVAAGSYQNSGTVEGASGIGFFENSGTQQFKNTGGSWDDIVGRTIAQTLSNKTLITPTIASFTNATHNHQNAAGGGTLAEPALALTDITTNNVSTSAHGFMPKLTNVAGNYFDATGAYNNTYIWRHSTVNNTFTSITGGTGEGTGGSRAASGGDIAGKITITTGTSPSASATVETFVFSIAYGSAPYVLLTPGNAAAAALSGNGQVYISSTSTTQFVITAGSTNLVASTQYIWYYQVIQ